MIPFNHDSNNVALNKKRRLFFSGCVSRSMTRLAILACEENRKLPVVLVNFFLEENV